MAVHTYALTNDQILEPLLNLFCDQNFPVTVENGAQLLPLELDNIHAKAH